jgi:YVTN family beta-propeller protein
LLAGALLSLASAAHAAPFAYITQSFSFPGTVAVVDTANNSVVTTITVGFSPFGVAAHPSGSHVYIGNMDDNSVSVIATASNTVVATVPVGMGPMGLAVHPNGSRLYVANYYEDTVSVIDTATNTVVPGGTITIDAGPPGNFDGPIGLAVNPAGTRLYVVNNESFSVSVIDTATLAVVATVKSGMGQRPVGVAVHPTGAWVYITNAMSSNVAVLDTATNTVATTVAVGMSPRGVAVHPSGSHVYVATGSGTVSVISTASHTVVASPSVAPGLYGISVSPSGTHVYAANQDSGTVVALATATNTLAGQVPVPDGPTAFGLFITPEAAASCDTTALQQELAAVNGQVAQLQASKQSLTDDNEQLRAELAGVRATLDSFLDRLFGGRIDANVAGAARTAALTRLSAAKRAVPATKWRWLNHAQQSFDNGDKAMKRRDWRRAVHEFREAYEWAGRITIAPSTVTGPSPAPQGATASGPSTTAAGSSSCDTTALQQELAAAKRQVEELLAGNRALTDENQQLRAELAALRDTLESFVDRLFGGRADANVAAAARTAALARLTAAKAVPASENKWVWLRCAQLSFENGDKAVERRDWRRAVREFREAHEWAERIVAYKPGRWHRR